MNNSYYTMTNGVRLSFDSEWKKAEELIVSAKTMKEMKELDSYAIEHKGIPSLWLMENAAKAVVDTVAEYASDSKDDAKIRQTKICIICGAGNNGGDGVACAYMLMDKGYQVKAYLCGKEEKMTPDERAMEERLIARGGKLIKWFESSSCDCNVPSEEVNLIRDIKEADCVIDALFGVGISRSIEGLYADIIAALNQAKIIVACDIPSGINGDTGEVMGCAVKADVTVTFSYIKQGLTKVAAADNVGLLKVVPIGLPE